MLPLVPKLDRVLQFATEPSALDGVVATPNFGEIPVGQIFVGTTMDQFIHGWDLAKATGQDTTLDRGPGGICLRNATSDGFVDMGRQAGFIGPEIAVPDDGPQDKLIAYMGCQP